jgi:hypothetical protein
MEEFENLSLYELRQLLVDRLEETYGRDYAFGWLKTAYAFGHNMYDTERDMLIKQIRDNTKVN